MEDKETAKAALDRKLSRRIWFVLIVLLVAFAVVIGQLGIIQIGKRDFFTVRAVSQQCDDITIAPHRGSIFDCNGAVLAQSAEVWKIIISPRDIQNAKINRYDENGVLTKVDARALIADELSAMLDIDRDALYERTGKSSRYEIVKTKVEYTLKEKVAEWATQNGVSGCVFIENDYKRYYPMGSLLSTVIGFTGTDNTGLEGLEASYEQSLSGLSGRVVTARNGVGGKLPTEMEYSYVVDAEDGKNLVLTIDAYIQSYAEKRLEEGVAATGTLQRGTVIIQDVKTGGILAMTTKGDYDPNDPFTVKNATTATMLERLSGTEKSAATSAALQAQWRNKALSDTYEPGSVFKMFTGSMALEEGVADLSTTYTCTGGLRVPGWNAVIHCANTHGHGYQTLSQGLSNSCNPFFMTLGMAVGGKAFFKYFSSFGFTDITGIDMSGEQSNAGLYHSEAVLSSETDKSSLATSSFGQTFKVTPIQVITAVSSVANGGYLMQPYVVSRITDSDGNIISENSPVVKRQVISKETAATMAAMLQESATTGGAKNAYVAGYRVAGKTGTSEKRDTAEENDVVSSFAGFAPADDPQIAILVLLDDPQTAVRYGGTIAAPIAQKILSDVLPYMGIEPEYTDEELRSMNRVTPAVMNKSVEAAKTTLQQNSMTYTVLGEGNTVINQIPGPGSTIPKGGKVVLYTDEPSLETTVKMPDFRNCTLLQATQKAESAGVNLILSGVGLGSGEAKASEQDVEAGSEVSPGTVVTVRFIYEDNIA